MSTKKLAKVMACTILGTLTLSINVLTTEAVTNNIVNTNREALNAGIGFAMDSFKKAMLVTSANDDAVSISEEQTETEMDVTPPIVSIWDTSVIADVNEFVYIREEAGTDGKILGKLFKGAGGLIIDKGTEWTKIESGSVTGYVNNQFLAFGEEAEKIAKDNGAMIAEVKTTTLKVRKEADTDAVVLGMIGLGSEHKVLKELDDWVKIDFEGEKGYISKEYIELSYELDEAISLEEEAEVLRAQAAEEEAMRNAERQAQNQNTSSSNSSSSSNNSNSSSNSQSNSSNSSSNSSNDGGGATSGSGQAVANYAVQFVGNPYRWGGTSLTNGADCSGFVLAVYKHFGYNLNRSSGAQASNGRSVSIGNIQPGDLLFYSRSGKSGIGHVAIYIGGGKIVHASSAKTGIKISNYKYKTPIAARRIVK